MRELLVIHVITLPPESKPEEPFEDGGGGWGGGGGGGSFMGTGNGPGLSPLPSGPLAPGFGQDYTDFDLIGFDTPGATYQVVGVAGGATPISGGFVRSVDGTISIGSLLTGPILGVRRIMGEALGGNLEQFTGIPAYFFFTEAQGWFGTVFSRGPGGSTSDQGVEPHTISIVTL